MRVKIGLIGAKRSRAGYGIGQYVAREVLNYPTADLVALLGPTTTSLQKAVRVLNNRLDAINKFHGEIYSINQQAAFFNLPDLDLIIICSPVRTHEEFITRALQAGKHVLVEKPLLENSSLPLEQKVQHAKALIDLASGKYLFLTTNCQRVAAVEILNKKFSLPRHPSTINIELTIGAINKKLGSPRALFELLIAHPLSFLVKYGLTDYRAITAVSYVNKITTKQSLMIIQGAYHGQLKKITYKIKLRQLAKQAFASMIVRLDNCLPVEISSFQTAEHRIKTKYSTPNENHDIIYSEDHLKTFLDRMIDAVHFHDASHQPLISNRESFSIYCLQEKFKSSITFSGKEERSRIYA